MKPVAHMVSKCLNPKCHTPFLYLRDGKLIATNSRAANDRGRVEYFWLCSGCSAQLSMVPATDGRITLVPHGETHRRGLSRR